MKASRLNRELVAGRNRAIKRHQGPFVVAAEKALERSAKTTATRFRKYAVHHPLTAAAPGLTSASTMIAVYPSPAEAVAIARPNGEAAEILHVTLAFLGDTPPDVAEKAAGIARQVASEAEPIQGTIGGIASFGNLLADLWRVAYAHRPDGGYGDTVWNADTGTVRWIPADWTTQEEADAALYAFTRIRGVRRVEIADAESARPDDPAWMPVWPGERPLYPSIALPDVAGLAELRQAVCEALNASGVWYAENHGWTPHLTVAYTEELEPPTPELLGMPLSFDRLSLTRADNPRDFVLGQALTAAGGPSGDWTPPHPDEIFDLDRFIASLHTSTDPVRRAVIETMMAKPLDGAGLNFDVTNPYVGRVLASSGSRVVGIGETTRLNLMRTIRESYEAGLSVPETAKVIEEAMSGAAPARAKAIARTELGAVTNGGAVAAAQIVGDAAGITYWKRWLTAPGARDPRHEDYEGLDGQTVAIGDRFEVGDAFLEYPGDPEGPPEEIINCRCAVAMVESPDAELGADESPIPEEPEDPGGYRVEHTSPGPDGGAPMHELTRDIYPDDVYNEATQVRHYGQGGDAATQAMDRKAFKVVNEVRGNPDAEVTIFRAVPGDVNRINAGDWVTPSKGYAEQHAASEADWHVISAKVRAGDLYTDGNSIQEWGWHPAVPPKAAPGVYPNDLLESLVGQEPEHLANSLLEHAAPLEPAITATLRAVVDPSGGSLEGLAFKLKNSDSLARKIRDKAIETQTHPREIAAEITDVLRYTAIYQPGEYTVKMARALESLKRRGYEVVPEHSHNFWRGSGSEYVGVNTVVRAPNGYRFELQFHTPESFHTKDVVNHPLYEQARAHGVDPATRARLTDEMTKNADAVPRPPGIIGFRLPGVTDTEFVPPSQLKFRMPIDLEPGRKDLVSALASLDQRLQLPEGAGLAEVKIVGQIADATPDTDGQFNPATRTITLRRLGRDRYESFVHEFGHFLDAELGNGHRYGTSISPAFDKWVSAVKASPTYERVRKAYYDQAAGPGPGTPIILGNEAFDPRIIDYALDRRELWARSFVQWLALRDPRLRDRVELNRSEPRYAALGWFWSDAEFAPIAAEIDAIFRERGWLR